MKKLLFLLIVPFAITACQQDPDLDELSDDYVVFTTYDPSFSFSTPTNVYVPSAITLLDNVDGTTDVWNDADAQRILSEFSTKLTSAGYTVVNTELGADLYLEVSFLENVTYFVDYPYWWWDPYWWDGYWPDWYYPYPVVYGYAVGSLIGELVDPSLVTGDELPSVWYTYIAGDESNSTDYDTDRIVDGIDQAFKQSTYLKK